MIHFPLKTHIWNFIKWTLAAIGVLLVCLLLFLGGYIAYLDWKINHVWTSARIENITGLKFPKCKPNMSTRGALYDFCDVEFKTTPSDELFEEINKRIAAGDTLWKKDGDAYTFFINWNYGFPAPKGEEKEKYGSFRMSITKGEPQALIRYGHEYNGHSIK